MVPKAEHLDAERANLDFFLDIPPPRPPRREGRLDQGLADARAAVRVQRGLRRLRRDAVPEAAVPDVRRPDARRERHRLLLDLRRQPADDALVTATRTAAGPAWSNSLFEDNAEFGLGMRLALDQQVALRARRCSSASAPIDRRGPRPRDPRRPPGRRGATRRPARARRAAQGDGSRRARTTRLGTCSPIADALVRKERLDRRRRRLGLRHRLRRARPRAGERARRQRARARHAGLLEHGRAGLEGDAARAPWRSSPPAASRSGEKDLGLIAAAYGNVYVAQVALGADNAQTVKAFAEAESWPGPSLIIAYSTCIAHGIDMSTSMSHQTEAVKSGFWPLWRYDPRLGRRRGNIRCSSTAARRRSR